MSDPKTASAPGKIILSGEYAVLFGFPGIAIPSEQSIDVTWIDDQEAYGISLHWEGHADGDPWAEYARLIFKTLEPETGVLHGILSVTGTLPLGKGMGSSTALIVAICRCLLGPDCAKIACMIENALSPNNSGIDFAVIWAGKPILFKKEEIPETVDFDMTKLAGYELLDTGTPGERTSELVRWIRSREAELKEPLETIGQCTKRLLRGEPIRNILRDHHRAQVVLGVVPATTQAMIAEIEANGGSAKVIGAGGRTGGGGIVLALPPETAAA